MPDPTKKETNFLAWLGDTKEETEFVKPKAEKPKALPPDHFSFWRKRGAL